MNKSSGRAGVKGMPKMPRPKSIKTGISSVVKRGKDETVDQDAVAQTQDLLEEFNIDLEVRVKPDILLPEQIDKVEFTTSEPYGYHPDEVNEFVGETEKSVTYYIRLVERKNQDLHKLINEINQSRTDIENLKYQLQIHRARGVAIVDEDGEYATQEITAEEDARAAELQDEITRLSNELTDMQTQFKEMSEYADSMEEYAQELQSQIDAGGYTDEEQDFVDQQVDDFVGDHLEESEYDEEPASDDDIASLQQQIEEFNSWADTMEKDHAEAQEEIEQLKAQIVEWEAYADAQESEGGDDSERVAELTEDLYTLREQLNTSEREKDELYENYQAVSEQNKTYEEHIASMEAYADELEKTISRMEDEKNNVSIELDSDRRRTSVKPKNVVSLVEEDEDEEEAPRESQKPLPRQRKKRSAPAPRINFEDISTPEV